MRCGNTARATRIRWLCPWPVLPHLIVIKWRWTAYVISRDIASHLARYARCGGKQVTSAEIRKTQSGEDAILHSVDELNILCAGSVDIVAYLVR